MKLNGILIPVIIDGLVRRKDGSLSVRLETQEIGANQAGELHALAGKLAFAYLSGVEPDANEQKIIDSLDPELKAKSQGQRLRSVLFVWWQANKDKPNVPDVFDYFYKQKMETFIEMIKSELN